MSWHDSFLLKPLLLLGVGLCCLAATEVPELPRVYLNTKVDSPGESVVARSAAVLKEALIGATCGDTIHLLPGVEYVGNFTLPSKACDGWITLQTRTELPERRVSPKLAGSLAKLISPNEKPAVTVMPGARNWRLLGLEVTSSNTTIPAGQPLPTTWNLVEARPGSLALILDRCFIHGRADLRSFRGVLLEGASQAVVRSWIEEIHYDGFDSQAVGGSKGPGPFLIEDNHLEGAGENIMFGGARSPAGVIPSDIVITNNHIVKPLRWEQNTDGWDKSKWTIKNLVEFKAAQRVLVENNVLENNWQQAQVGVAVLFTVRTSQGGCHVVVNDITFRNNLIRGTQSGFSIQGRDDQAPNESCRGEAKRLRIENNLVEHRPSNQAYHVLLSYASEVSLLNNTFAWTTPCRFGIRFGGSGTAAVARNVEIRNNVMCMQVGGDSAGNGADALLKYIPNPTPVADRFTGNFSFLRSGEKVAATPTPISGNTESAVNPFVDPGARNWRLKEGFSGGSNIGQLEEISSHATQ